MQRRQARSPALALQRSRLKADLCLSVVSAAFVATALGQSTLQFTATASNVSESLGAMTVNVQRSGDLTNDVTVDFASADGTATNGPKYCATHGTLPFAAGETNKAFVVSILNDGLVEGIQSFRVQPHRLLGREIFATVFSSHSSGHTAYGVQLDTMPLL
jgi:hypothetical protein